MKILIDINILLFIVYISIIAHNAHSFSLHDQKSTDQIVIEPGLIDDTSSSIDEYGSTEDTYPAQTHLSLIKRHLDSAEKYFDWASKTNRPMEYLRGKRFWAFKKKDEQNTHHQTIPGAGASSSSLGQGIWRSGILGRRSR